jgi:hypothetical protein
VQKKNNKGKEGGREGGREEKRKQEGRKKSIRKLQAEWDPPASPFQVPGLQECAITHGCFLVLT